MTNQQFKEEYEKLFNERVEEFTTVCLEKKSIFNTLYEPIKKATQEVMWAFSRFSVIQACLLKLKTTSLMNERGAILPQITKICELLDLILDEVENLSLLLKKYK